MKNRACPIHYLGNFANIQARGPVSKTYYRLDESVSPTSVVFFQPLTCLIIYQYHFLSVTVNDTAPHL